MTEEEYFRKNYPDYCYGDRPLSPYWDLFQDGVEFGERQSEKNIEELEQKNTELKKEVIENKSDCLTCYPHIKERLEKQLAQAKDLIKNILRVTWGEGWNYSLD